MLTTLRLKHFVLIETCTIHFEKGLNILTGETGAGKTILIQAINLLMGQKADSEIIRHGEEQAQIEATFDIKHLPAVHRLLSDAGIAFDPQEELIVKREISRGSKNRIFINAELAPLQLLARLGNLLFEVAGQNTSMALRNLEEQRSILDLFASVDRVPFIAAYEREKELKERLQALKNEKLGAEKKVERIQWELEDLQTLEIQESEEDLFEVYKQMNQRQERAQDLSEIVSGLTESPFISTLIQYKKKLETLSDLSEPAKLLEDCITNLNEVSYTLSDQFEEENPMRLEALEKKLSALSRMKKKYHLEASEIPERIVQLEEELHHFETLDTKIQAIEDEWKQVHEARNASAQALTLERQQGAQILEKELTHAIRLLNMPHASFQISLTEKDIGPEGADQISFALTANLGENPAPLKNKTSGGELSRLFFALKLLLSEKESIPILIFDEIDSNIGGETATLIGEKLRDLGEHRQVFCITHFPQVARFAERHFLIAKETKEDRTLTLIKPLNENEKQTELLRMVGGVKNFLEYE